MSGLKVIILPPLIALFIYLLIVFAILPLYRQRQRYAAYVPISLPSHIQPHSIRDWLLDRLASYSEPLASHLHRRTYSGLSDEEMVDPVAGLEELHEHGRYEDVERGRTSRRDDSREDHQRRLSRDLEAGFRDDSDDEDEVR